MFFFRKDLLLSEWFAEQMLELEKPVREHFKVYTHLNRRIDEKGRFELRIHVGYVREEEQLIAVTKEDRVWDHSHFTGRYYRESIKNAI